MSKATIEDILNQISQLPAGDQARLRRLLDESESPHIRRDVGLDQRVPPVPVPDSSREMQWLSEHQREYAGEWVALDGDRLIAHSVDARFVYSAAEADGANLPFVAFVEGSDKHNTILWK